MATPRNPFDDIPKARPGHGSIHIANLAGQAASAVPLPVLQTLEYQYPLKLVAPSSLTVAAATPTQYNHKHDQVNHDLPVITIFTLSYGGGLVAGDAIKLTITLDARTRLNLLTQGSTKIFKNRPGSSTTAVSGSLTTQTLTTHVAANAALVYLPDPVQPFADSNFRQHQTYALQNRTASLCVLDWVTSGRSARGENWDCRSYESRNEVYARAAGAEGGKGRLLIRDNIRLDAEGSPGLDGVSVADRVNGWGVIGTLILTGPLFERLTGFFMNEFGALPRIGAPRSMLLQQSVEAQGLEEVAEEVKRKRKWREARVERERRDGVLWTASRVREVFVLVKFAAASVEGGRQWLRGMLEYEGSVVGVVGERGLLCL